MIMFFLYILLFVSNCVAVGAVKHLCDNIDERIDELSMIEYKLVSQISGECDEKKCEVSEEV